MEFNIWRIDWCTRRKQGTLSVYWTNIHRVSYKMEWDNRFVRREWCALRGRGVRLMVYFLWRHIHVFIWIGAALPGFLSKRPQTLLATLYLAFFIFVLPRLLLQYDISIQTIATVVSCHVSMADNLLCHGVWLKYDTLAGTKRAVLIILSTW